MKKFLFFVMLLVASTVVRAQMVVPVPEELKEQIEAKVNVFNAYVKDIADKDISLDKRKSYVKAAEKFFYGKCDSTVWDGTPDIAKMEVTSATKGTSKVSSMRRYLNNLLNLRYKDVEIKYVGNFLISDLVMEGKDHGTCTVTYGQLFKGTNGDGYSYSDYTEKKMTIRVDILSEDDETGEIAFRISLWDSACVGTILITGSQFDKAK